MTAGTEPAGAGRESGAAGPAQVAAGCAPGTAGQAGATWMWVEDGAGILPDAPLPMLLVTATKLMGAFWAGTVQATGIKISPAGLGVLRVLLANDGLKSSEVAARGLSSPGTLTSVVDTLVGEGYVERRGDPGDRRVVRLHLTGKGRHACEEYAARAGPAWRNAFDFVSQEDEAVVRRFFVQMIQQFGKLAREERGK